MKKIKYSQAESQATNEPISEAEIGFAQNPEPRCACVILTDCSSSMNGKPIDELNNALHLLKTKLLEDQLASLRVELALVTFNDDVTVAVDFCSPENFSPPTLSASGGTMMGAAVTKGIEILSARRAEYRAAGNSFYRPWMVCLTDGKPTDDIAEAAKQVKEAEAQKRLSFFGIGVQGADMNKLGRLSFRPPRELDGLNFSELFEWLSVNLASVAASRPGEQVPLPKSSPSSSPPGRPTTGSVTPSSTRNGFKSLPPNGSQTELDLLTEALQRLDRDYLNRDQQLDQRLISLTRQLDRLTTLVNNLRLQTANLVAQLARFKKG